MASWKDSRFTFRTMPSSYKNARCNCCNSVSSLEIASDTGPHSSTRFYDDPHSQGFLCGECYGAYADQMDFFDDLDDLDEGEEELINGYED